MYVRKKTTRKGQTYHYLVQSVRVNGRVRQKVLCYLGRYDCIEDAFANAVGRKRRAKLAMYRDAADINTDQILAAQQRQYKRMQRGLTTAPASAIRVLLPLLPPLADLPQGRPVRHWRRRR